MTLLVLLLLLVLLDLAVAVWGADSRTLDRRPPPDPRREDWQMDALTGGWWAGGSRRW